MNNSSEITCIATVIEKLAYVSSAKKKWKTRRTPNEYISITKENPNKDSKTLKSQNWDEFSETEKQKESQLTYHPDHRY